MKVNINNIVEHFNIPYNDIFDLNKNKLKHFVNNLRDEKDGQCFLIEELLDMRDGIVNVEFNFGDETEVLRYAEIKNMLDQVSTDFLIN